jgi:drug/metabolite transporter (DMT)-like permease
MRTSCHAAFAALATAGLLWGSTVPLTKVALAGMGPGWLTVARFALAAVPLCWLARRRLRAAWSGRTLAWGAGGYGGVIVLQNVGIARTSVSHAALIVGATPVLVALFSIGLGRARVGVLAWLGFAVALTGVGVIVSRGGSADLRGDLLVFGSLFLSAAFVVAQPRMLAGRDPVAVTAVQVLAAALATVPAAWLLDGPPSTALTRAAGWLGGSPSGTAAGLAVAGLAIAGTLAPFTLFAYGQARVPPEIAGAFLNIEPVVGAIAGALVFGDAVGFAQLLGGAAVLGGIGLSAVPSAPPAAPPSGTGARRRGIQRRAGRHHRDQFSGHPDRGHPGVAQFRQDVPIGHRVPQSSVGDQAQRVTVGGRVRAGHRADQDTVTAGDRDPVRQHGTGGGAGRCGHDVGVHRGRRVDHDPGDPVGGVGHGDAHRLRRTDQVRRGRGERRVAGLSTQDHLRPGQRTVLRGVHRDGLLADRGRRLRVGE